VAGAKTTTGDSLLRPYSACMRSACSVFVGSPVDGRRADIEDDQRQLGHHREADPLALERDARGRSSR